MRSTDLAKTAQNDLHNVVSPSNRHAFALSRFLVALYFGEGEERFNIQNAPLVSAWSKLK